MKHVGPRCRVSKHGGGLSDFARSSPFHCSQLSQCDASGAPADQVLGLGQGATK